MTTATRGPRGPPGWPGVRSLFSLASVSSSAWALRVLGCAAHAACCCPRPCHSGTRRAQVTRALVVHPVLPCTGSAVGPRPSAHQEPREAETHVLARAPPPARGERTWPVVPSSSYPVRSAGERSRGRGAHAHGPVSTGRALLRPPLTGSGQEATSSKSEDRLLQTQSQRSSGSQKASHMPVRGRVARPGASG